MSGKAHPLSAVAVATRAGREQSGMMSGAGRVAACWCGRDDVPVYVCGGRLTPTSSLCMYLVCSSSQPPYMRQAQRVVNVCVQEAASPLT